MNEQQGHRKKHSRTNQEFGIVVNNTTTNQQGDKENKTSCQGTSARNTEYE